MTKRARTAWFLGAWTVTLAACAAHRDSVRETDVAAFDTRGGEESLCPRPSAIGGGPAATAPVASTSLGSVPAPTDATRVPQPSTTRPRAATSNAGYSTAPPWYSVPPPVQIESGPSPTLGAAGGGFTIPSPGTTTTR
jgi:hypothetical protein